MQVKSAFTMVESLFCLSIMGLMLVLCIPNMTYQSEFVDSKTILSQNIYRTQLNALTTKQKISLSLSQKETPFSFNAFGNINQAGRFNLNNNTCVFQLGTGRFYFE